MDYSYDIMRMTKIRFYEWDRSELKFCCERMVRLRNLVRKSGPRGFRAVLFRMVPKLFMVLTSCTPVLELCCFEWFQNYTVHADSMGGVLELCCFEWFQNNVF